MWPLGIEIAPPYLADDLRLDKAVEYLAVEEFVAQLRREALAATILSRTSGFDGGGLRACNCGSHLLCFGNELRAVVRSNMTRHTMQDEHVR
jgi:hypothetical protein